MQPDLETSIYKAYMTDDEFKRRLMLLHDYMDPSKSYFINKHCYYKAIDIERLYEAIDHFGLINKAEVMKNCNKIWKQVKND